VSVDTKPTIDHLRAEVAAHPLWYHTIELAPGIVTPGWFDLRQIVERMPWPDLNGLRCLDVGTYDGFLAFELERRGAAEVVAIDIADHESWDWPAEVRGRGTEFLADIAGPDKGAGFRIARRALGSNVDRRELSVYDLAPERLGEFDFITCGALLLHLRDPLRALEAIRSVCRGRFLSAEQISPLTTLLHPRRPLLDVGPALSELRWWTPNAAGHRRLVEASGFAVERAVRPYAVAFGPSHPRAGGGLRRALLTRLVARGDGIPHSAVLARPRV